MELKQMEMFVAVVQEGTIRAAASRVFRTQPAVSIAVRKLEDEFETPLFDRTKRYQRRLTPAGEELYVHAIRMLALYKEAIGMLGEFSKIRRRVRIGANESISHLIPKLAQEFLNKHTDIGIEVVCKQSECLLADLRCRKLDLVLISFKPEHIDFTAKFILKDQSVLITRPQHHFAEKGRVKIKELSGVSLLSMDISEPLHWRKTIEDAFVQNNVPFNLVIANAPVETIKKMVAAGLGVGLVPLLSVREEQERGALAVVVLDGLPQERSVWLVQLRGVQSHATNAFARVVESSGDALCGHISLANTIRQRTSSIVRPEKLVRVKRTA